MPFTIFPEKITIPKKHGYMFQFKAYSTKKGKLSETFQLMAQIGKERKSNLLLSTTIEGNFLIPSLSFSEQRIHFKYIWTKDIPMMPISKTLEITCNSILPANFSMKSITPFSISKDNFSLLPGKSDKLKIDFDPGYKGEKFSFQESKKLQINHIDHPHKDFVELIGELSFPNLKLEKEFINFGSILNETSKRMIINMKNISEMSLNYEWTFIEEEIQARDDSYKEGDHKKNQGGKG